MDEATAARNREVERKRRQDLYRLQARVHVSIHPTVVLVDPIEPDRPGAASTAQGGPLAAIRDNMPYRRNYLVLTAQLDAHSPEMGLMSYGAVAFLHRQHHRGLNLVVYDPRAVPDHVLLDSNQALLERLEDPLHDASRPILSTWYGNGGKPTISVPEAGGQPSLILAMHWMAGMGKSNSAMEVNDVRLAGMTEHTLGDGWRERYLEPSSARFGVTTEEEGELWVDTGCLWDSFEEETKLGEEPSPPNKKTLLPAKRRRPRSTGPHEEGNDTPHRGPGEAFRERVGAPPSSSKGGGVGPRIGPSDWAVAAGDALRDVRRESINQTANPSLYSSIIMAVRRHL